MSYKLKSKSGLINSAFNSKFTLRNTDSAWIYEGLIRKFSCSGFNPFLSKIFISKTSMLNKWIKNDFRQPRKFNFEDRLAKEICFFTHDFLHSWAVNSINNLLSENFLSSKKITFDEKVALFLLTEAVATAGVDYWYFCNNSIEYYIEMGSTFTGGLTTRYHASQQQEFLKFSKDLVFYEQNFLGKLFHCYLTGDFIGISPQAYKLSAIIQQVIEQELYYGEVQRVYAREFIHYMLTADQTKLSPDKLKSPLKISNRSIVKEIAKQIAHELWTHVQTNYTNISLNKNMYALKLLKTKEIVFYDFRFLNALAFNYNSEFLKDNYYLYQLVSSIPLSSLSKLETEKMAKAQNINESFKSLIVEKYKQQPLEKDRFIFNLT